MVAMAISPARKIAYEVLRRVEAEGAYATDVLHEELGAAIKTEDAGLATEITLGVLRWRRLLDLLLDRELKKPVAKLDLPVALALRMGLYQLRFLERIPARAAVNESVELVKHARKTSAASLVNAVLRRAAERAKEPSENALPQNTPLVERLGILHSHPTWLVERWIARWGEERAVSLLEENNRVPRLSCALHAEERREEVFHELKKAGLRVEPGRLLKAAFAVAGGSPARMEAFRKGHISIQDEASQAIPLLLDVQRGDSVLDLCAAPGGKTAPLVRAAGAEGIVIAADRHAHRLRAMRAQLDRLGLLEVRLVEMDATQPLPLRREFERILIDAPCSGTGTLARHPEIRWRLQAEQLRELHRLQAEMLSAGLAQLARGGRLVYSTCSLEREENEEVVAEVLLGTPSVRRVEADLEAKELSPHLAPGINAAALFDDLGDFRTSPPEHHTDGFFAAILQKT
jgi:16S rRNA (cytosine967-C5)-methyltransferase